MGETNNNGMLAKTNNFLMIIKNVVSIIALVLIVGIAIFFVYDYFNDKTILTSKYGFFEISVSDKYNFIDNEGDFEDYIMAKYDANKSVYLYAGAYENDDITNFKSYATEYYEYYLTDEADVRKLSKPEKVKINDYEAYLITFEYTDYDNDNKEYYLEYYLINCKNGYYAFMIECLTKEKDMYKNDFSKIAKTFKELE